jgi:hypothetical protein
MDSTMRDHFNNDGSETLTFNMVLKDNKDVTVNLIAGHSGHKPCPKPGSFAGAISDINTLRTSNVSSPTYTPSMSFPRSLSRQTQLYWIGSSATDPGKPINPSRCQPRPSRYLLTFVPARKPLEKAQDRSLIT